MRKKLIWSAGGAIVVFAALQLFNPPHTNPPVKADFIVATQPPAAVAATVRAACYDCHSYETRWPFYARIAPVSWLIASDVTRGREHLNLSDWPADPARAAKNLDRMNEVIDYHEMPLAKYTLLHADARLNDAQRKDVLAWTDAAANLLRKATNSEAH